jgi:hypothetical protein
VDELEPILPCARNRLVGLITNSAAEVKECSFPSKVDSSSRRNRSSVALCRLATLRGYAGITVVRFLQRVTFSTYTPILDTTDRKRLARTCNDIIRETDTAREWPNFPLNALAIGDNGGVDRLVFLPDAGASRFADAVYWWDHKTGELQLVADAFEQLK